MGEEIKTAIRNVHRDANDDIKKLEKNKDAHLSEDAARTALDDLQKIMDQFIKDVDRYGGTPHAGQNGEHTCQGPRSAPEGQAGARSRMKRALGARVNGVGRWQGRTLYKIRSSFAFHK